MNIAGLSEPIPAPPKSTRFVLPRAPITPGSVRPAGQRRSDRGKPLCGFVPVQLALGHHSQQLVWCSVLQPVADLRVDLLRSRRAWGEHHNQVAGAIHRVGDPTLPHKLGLADNSVVSRNTRSPFSWPTRRAMRCNPF